MNKLITAVVSLLLVFASTAFAGGENGERYRGGKPKASSSSSAKASAEAEANVDVRNKNKNVNKNRISVGDTSASATGGAGYGGAGGVGYGGSGGTGGSVDFYQALGFNFEAPKRVAPAPEIPDSSGSTPQIFWGPTLPANILGVNMTLEYLKACKPRYKKDIDVRDIVQKGASGLTSITFTPHANYFEQKNGEPVKEVLIAIPEDESSSDKYVCLGIMKVEALMKKATDSQFDTLTNDAGMFGSENFKGGYTEVYLITVPGAISKNLGVSNRGGGAGIAPALSSLAGETFRGVGTSFSGQKGDTFTTGQLGVTFVVVAKPKDGDRSVEFKTGNLLTVYKDSQEK